MAPSRFNRSYRLTVSLLDGREVSIVPPIRVSFRIDKSFGARLGRAIIQVYNLADTTRQAMQKSRHKPAARPIYVGLAVGYGDELRTVFRGSLLEGSTSRKGSDLITELEALDGGHDLRTAYTLRTVRAGERVIDAVLRDTTETGKGSITDMPQLTRARVLVGSSLQLIDELVPSGAQWAIDNGLLHILRDGEIVSRYIPEVNAASGMLGTPEESPGYVEFKTQLNPTIRIGGAVNLTSQAAPHMSGVYVVQAIGVSGDTHGSDWTMDCTAKRTAAWEVVT